MSRHTFYLNDNSKAEIKIKALKDKDASFKLSEYLKSLLEKEEDAKEGSGVSIALKRLQEHEKQKELQKSFAFFEGKHWATEYAESLDVIRDVVKAKEDLLIFFDIVRNDTAKFPPALMRRLDSRLRKFQDTLIGFISGVEAFWAAAQTQMTKDNITNDKKQVFESP